MDFIFGVEYDRDDLLARQPEIILEIVARVLKRLRFLHLRTEIHCMAVIILKQPQHLVQRSSWNEHGSDPVVNQRARHAQMACGIPRLESPGYDFAAL